MKRLVVVAVLLLTMAACGGSSDSSSPPKASPSQTETTTAAPDPAVALKAAVHAYSTAFLTGDGATAYAILTKRCRATIALSELASASESAKSLYGNVPIKTLAVKVNNDRATATYTYPVKTIDQTDQPWVFESGAWHYDQC